MSYTKSNNQSPPDSASPFRAGTIGMGDMPDDKDEIEVFGGGGSSHNDSNAHTSKFNIN